MLQDRLMTDLKAHPPGVMAELPRIRDDLHDGQLTVTLGRGQAAGALPRIAKRLAIIPPLPRCS